MNVSASAWAEGEFFRGEGYANYACIGGKWFSVNGTKSNVVEIRWEVRDEKKIKTLEEFCGLSDED